jgi:hypothetical protein
MVRRTGIGEQVRVRRTGTGEQCPENRVKRTGLGLGEHGQENRV